MKCAECPYRNKCKRPNANKPACLMLTKYEKTLKMARIPKKYRECTLDNLPIEKDNPQAYEYIKRYCSNIINTVIKKGISLYLFSVSSSVNPLGTGTGKTTSACTILNHFVEEANWAVMKREIEIDGIPALFVRCSDFQNIYNAQFREQEGASAEYYRYKNNMKTCALLVLDDIAMRGCTEAFTNELYEVINHRCIEELATIYTSNVPIKELDGMLDYRIISRIAEDCVDIGFKGKDNRRC